MLCYSVGDKVRLVTNTLFVTKGSEGVVVEPVKGQTPPQLFPNRVQFPDGQSTRTVWCGTDELELVDDTRLTTDDSVADGSRDYCSEGGPEDRDVAHTTPTGPCPCVTGGQCQVDWTGFLVEGKSFRPDPPASEFDTDEGPWSEDWEWDGLSQFEEAVVGVFVDAQELLFKKHKDYGPRNISQSPGGPLNGLRVRMHDKLARLNHLVDKADGVIAVKDEKLTDTLLDLANYAIIAVLVLKGEWPSE